MKTRNQSGQILKTFKAFAAGRKLLKIILIYIDVAVCQWAGRIVLYTNLKNLMSKILENSLLYLRLDQCVIYLIEREWWEGRKARRKQQTPFFSFFSRSRDFEKCLFSSSERRESCTKTRIVCIYKGPSKFPFYISPLLSFGVVCVLHK